MSSEIVLTPENALDYYLDNCAEWELPTTLNYKPEGPWVVAKGVVTIPQFRDGNFVDTKAECVMLNDGRKFLTTAGSEALGSKPPKKKRAKNER